MAGSPEETQKHSKNNLRTGSEQLAGWWQRWKQPRSPFSKPLPLIPKTPLSYGIVVTLGLLAAVATGMEMSWVKFVEQQTHTLFFRWRGVVPAPEKIVILAIDDQTLSVAQTYADDPAKRELLRLLPTFPGRREAYARAIDYVMGAGARGVVLDLLLDLPSGYGETDDQKLSQTLQRYRRQVVLATAYQDSQTPQGLMTDLIKPTPALQVPDRQLGLANFIPSAMDGRVYELGTTYREQVLRPLSRQDFPSLAEASLAGAQVSYPPPRGKSIYFYGEAGTFQRIPFWQALDPDWQKVYTRSGQFQDAIVLIGTTSSTAQFADLVRTPLAERLPGVELQATAMATLWQGRTIGEVFPHPLGRAFFVFFLIAGSGIYLCRPRLRPLSQLSLGWVATLGWMGLSYLSFTYGYWILPVALPVMAIGLGSLGIFALGATADGLERLRLRRTLERYIAPSIVAEILNRPETMETGQKLKAAVMFADIRGFTHLSSQLAPEQLIQQLNRYFKAMVDVIIKAGGTVDKFIGDAVMAEFGFPISRGEQQDALRAIEAALGMRRALAALRQEFRREGLVPFFNGIGICFGEVIAGDLGSLERREYGILGDTVNVASRVEAMTKQFWTDILITESVYCLVRDQVEVVYLGEHELRGRQGTVKLYSLIGQTPQDRLLYQQVLEELRTYLDSPDKWENLTR